MAFANGQYILIERSVYETAGGHESVRDKFVEDIYLAKAVKKGLKKRVLTANAPDLCSTRMYTDLQSQVQGWARIYYDAWNRSVWTAIWKIIEPMIYTQPAYIMPFIAMGLIVGPSKDDREAVGVVSRVCIHKQEPIAGSLFHATC